MSDSVLRVIIFLFGLRHFQLLVNEGENQKVDKWTMFHIIMMPLETGKTKLEDKCAYVNMFQAYRY